MLANLFKILVGYTGCYAASDDYWRWWRMMRCKNTVVVREFKGFSSQRAFLVMDGLGPRLPYTFLPMVNSPRAVRNVWASDHSGTFIWSRSISVLSLTMVGFLLSSDCMGLAAAVLSRHLSETQYHWPFHSLLEILPPLHFILLHLSSNHC